MIYGGVWKMFIDKNLTEYMGALWLWSQLLLWDLGSFSTAGIDESLEHGAVWSRTVEGCFCRELLEAGIDESLEHGAVWSRTVKGCFYRELLEGDIDES